MKCIRGKAEVRVSTPARFDMVDRQHNHFSVVASSARHGWSNKILSVTVPGGEVFAPEVRGESPVVGQLRGRIRGIVRPTRQPKKAAASS
ncbi:hypothetical protein JMUB5695_03393 [Mycobacterium heckeshornense]|nr:hypothetical protein JMUB5695_03393 [Mycobacterium heckeshornense]